MTSKKTKTSKSTIAGAFIAGATAAATAGLYYLYGPNGKKNRVKVEGWVIKAKGEVIEKLENTKELTEEKYHKIVDGVMSKYSKAKHVGEEKAGKLARELKKQWLDIEKDVVKHVNTKKVKNVRRKLAKKISPDTVS